ncbi:MAG: type II toxin-antitoxin system Phd/YefM family antitoxin [Thermomicrobiales bacterium]|nr:type II toxin-antitoxin system Phd/YefM family antitoxin [Thermomicrobiales bacterium]
MAVVVSASDAKKNLGSLLSRVRTNDEAIIVENRGAPTAAIISIAEFDMLKELKERARREEALQELRKLRAELDERQKDLTQEEADAIVAEIRSDTIQSLIKKGVIRYED